MLQRDCWLELAMCFPVGNPEPETVECIFNLQSRASCNEDFVDVHEFTLIFKTLEATPQGARGAVKEFSFGNKGLKEPSFSVTQCSVRVQRELNGEKIDTNYYLQPPLEATLPRGLIFKFVTHTG